MSVTIPTIEPSSFVCGDTVQWTKSLSDFPATTYTLTYSFVKDGKQFAVTGAASGTDYLMTILAATSAALTAGTYRWQAYATLSTARYPVGSGTTVVTPNFAVATTGYDDRTHVKKVLDALEAVILGKASNDQLATSINGHSLSKYSPAELITWRNQYRAFYAQEQKEERIAQGLGHSGKVRIRFLS